MKSTKKEKKQYKKAFQEAMARELREHKSSFIVFSILRILVLVVLVRQIMLANYEGAFFCILTLLLLYVPSWIQVKLRIELPPPLEITIFCFIFAAEILGEVNAFYVVIPGWDTMLHTINGFLAAAVGFSMVMLLNDDDCGSSLNSAWTSSWARTCRRTRSSTPSTPSPWIPRSPTRW